MVITMMFGIIFSKSDVLISELTGIGGFYIQNTGMSIFCLGIFGAIWQILTVKYVCPSCKKDAMIPVDTPKGRQLMLDAESFVSEGSIDAAVPVTDHYSSTNIQAENTPNSLATINRTVGLFVVCGLVLSVLVWWKFGRMDKEIITKIDFRNHTYSSAGFGSEPVTLKNGKFIDHGDFGTNFNSVEYVDFNNDGENEAVVSIGTDIDGSAAYIEDYFVYSYQKNQLKEIYHTARQIPPKEIKVVGNTMVITGYHWRSDDPESSPSDIETTTYSWKNGAISELSKQLGPVVPELQIPTNEPTPYYSKDMPSNVRLLVDKWGKSYGACREGDESNIETMKLCDEEPQLSSAIKKLGWCYGEDAASMAERKWKECIARSGEPISYPQFYAKARTSMQPGKRYRFQASLNQYGCLDTINYSGNQSLCEAGMGNFDDNSEKLKFFESGGDYKGEVVAGMVYGSNGRGVIAIYRLPEIDTGSAKNYRVFELEEDTSEPTISAYVAPGKDFKQETPSINHDPSKQEDLESDKTENTSSAETTQIMVMRMLEYALGDGGLSRESEIQQVKLQIESAPKPVKGNKMAARALNDRGLASSKEGDFNNAVKMFEEANKLDKSDIEIVSNLGFSYFKQGNLDAAQQAIITTLTMSPGRAIAWTNLGEVFGVMGDESQAVACFSNAYRFSKDRLKTHQFMKKLNETEDVEHVKQARAKAIDWAEKSYLNI